MAVHVLHALIDLSSSFASIPSLTPFIFTMFTSIRFASLLGYDARVCPFEIVFVDNLLGNKKNKAVRAKVEKLVADVGMNLGVLYDVMPTSIAVV